MLKKSLAPLLALLLGLAIPSAPGWAQYSEEPEKPPAAAPPPSSGGPIITDSGPRRSVDETVIVPRKRPVRPPQPEKKPDRPRQDETFVFQADVRLVEVGVVVRGKKGDFIPNLTKEHFRVSEDGVPQEILKMEAAEAPVTVALVIEFSDRYWQFLYQTMDAAYGFVNALQPEDWVAVIAYDMRTEILQDFTQNKAAAFGALNMMQIPGFSESNLFDAVTELTTRMEDLEGRKAIVLISSGVDTFSKARYDRTLKLVQGSSTPIYAIGTGQALRLMYDARGWTGGSQRIGFLQADNQLRSFAKLSGGRSYFPRFEGQFPEIYGDISASLRNEYNLSYSPTNTAKDGKFRKIKVELVAPDGQRLKIVDEKGKEIKYEINAREGYLAPREVE